jgi:hypothetical protein
MANVLLGHVPIKSWPSFLHLSNLHLSMHNTCIRTYIHTYIHTYINTYTLTLTNKGLE